MINFSSVSKIFKSTIAVNKISFTINKGEIVGLLGPNGAGKTTTMRLLVGILKPTEGKISIDGKDPIEDRLSLLVNIGYLAEGNPLYNDLTPREYLHMVARIKTGKNIYINKNGIDIDNVLDQKIGSLSRGYRQRVGLAAALVGDPDVLILDEPTSGLDPIEQDNLLKTILKLSTKRTIIVSTHILSEVEKIATKLLIMNNGKICFNGKKPLKKGSIEKLFKTVIRE